MNPEKSKNQMRTVKIEKVVLSVGGTGDVIERGYKLLEILTNKKPAKMKTNKRIPALGIRPNLEIGVVSTVREGKEAILKRMLTAINNTLRKRQISENNFSFGIKEYIEIPGIEYNREVGIMGLDVTVVFKRVGRRVRLKKIKRGKIPSRQNISKEEIIKFMEDNFQTKFR